jgi:pilus assembly protein FimV
MRRRSPDQSLNHAILGDDIDIINEQSASGIDLVVDLTAAENMTDEEIAAQSQERLNEVKVLLKYGLKERALDHLNRVFEIDPYNIDGRELARDILLSLDRRKEALDHLFLLAEVFKTSQPEGSIYYLHEILKADKADQRAKQMIRELGGIMPEGMEDSRVTTMGTDDEPVLLDDDEDFVLVDDDDLHQADAVMGHDDIDSDLDDWDLASEPPSAEQDTLSDSLPREPSPEKKSAFVRDHTVVEVVDYLEDPIDLSDVDELDGDIAIEDEDDVDDEEEIHDEFDPVAQSVLDIEASHQKQSDMEEEIAAPSKSMEEVTTADPVRPALSEKITKPQPPVLPEEASVADEPLPEINDDLEEIEFFLEQELFEEADAALMELASQYPKDPRIRALAARLKETVSSSEKEEPKDSDEKTNSNASFLTDSNDNEGSVQFKNVGIKEKLSDSDSATNWDLGLAYKEMGLFEDAVHAFEFASRDPARTASAKNMIGICYAALSRMDEAVQTFNDGLKVVHLNDNEKMGLLYELGKTFQMMKRYKEAFDCFDQICKIDNKFADAAARIRALSNTLSKRK